MAIEGPLKDLGIHDVFQLLDLGRKTGILRVTSAPRDNEGTVFFERGRLVAAQIRSNPHRLGVLLLRAGKVTEADLAVARARQMEHGDQRRIGEILVASGVLTARELERQVRTQIEAVVFELLSWREGSFRFEEQPLADAVDSSLAISTESVLMEAARRIEDWSRVADRVPGLEAIPRVGPVRDDRSSHLDLLPSEWEVLTQVDGTRDLRAIAAGLARPEFDVARVVYGLVATGVLELSMPLGRRSGMGTTRTLAAGAVESEDPEAGDVESLWRSGRDAVRRGALVEAADRWTEWLARHGTHRSAPRVRRALEMVRALDEAIGEGDGGLG